MKRIYSQQPDTTWLVQPFSDGVKITCGVLALPVLTSEEAMQLADAIKESTYSEGLPMWCPVCKNYHVHVGEKTDAGKLLKPCPNLDTTDPRNYDG